jgi:CHAD domain-containing protein
MTEPIPMMDFVAGQVALRLTRVAREIRRCREKPDPDPVHDLRVSIRRFTQSLRTFELLLPRREVKKVRRQLRAVLKLAGTVRDYDIALELLAKSGYPDAGPVAGTLRVMRSQSVVPLTERLGRLDEREFAARWRSRLQLERAS